MRFRKKTSRHLISYTVLENTSKIYDLSPSELYVNLLCKVSIFLCRNKRHREEALHTCEVYNRISLLFGFCAILMKHRQELFEWCGNRLRAEIFQNPGFGPSSGF